MAIGGIDEQETVRLRKRQARQFERSIKGVKKFCSTQGSNIVSTALDEDETHINFSKTNLATETLLTNLSFTITPTTSFANRNLLQLPTLAKVCDRYRLSTRSAAAVASAVLVDVGLVSNEDSTLVIYKNKVHRAVSKAKKNIFQNICEVSLNSIYFDGRKDKTLVNKKIGVRYHRKVVLEEHISILSEPNSIFLGHTSPCLVNPFSSWHKISKGGVIKYLEEYLDRALQWCVCMLHANELPFCHLFLALDGCTSGPREYSGPIGKQLATYKNKTTLLFQPLTGHLPDLTKNVVNELSTDQKYLYKICQTVLTGSCSSELANRQPGNLSHSRWLTCANRLFRLYVSTPDPSESLQILVKYVVKVYAPIWFSIKQKTSFKDGAKHIFNLILISRYLPTNLRTIVDSVIERNAFYAHPVNLLVSMLFDDRDYIRELACRRIIKARNTDNGFKQRIFKTPKLNFSAKDYTEIISWQECQVTLPPVLRDVTNDELKKMAKDGSLKIVDFPCHTQSVKRCVKLVTEVSQSVTNVNSRDGFVRTTLQSRAEFPIFGHKNKFKF
ncbi:hypothetical protein HELRODRAFT_163757 [Helobdella robusta]|uniref:Uncharacterized protein n=1 Tax=Helobdella robusta TaxID=6412 RepID=T1EUF4_HELRO|nr:hypothetical protein HELRODRAFT_163757 [Helobdella robusta]ESN96663.1 hypothetical protein HELRODRAFT_163757 [Helobdella robusta]